VTPAQAPVAPVAGASPEVRACPVCGSRKPAPLFTKDGFEMVRCTVCGCVHVAQDPAAIDFDALYGEAYYTGGSEAVFADYVGQEAARRAQARRKLWTLRHLPPRVPRSGRLLDVGCAAGFFLAEARAHYEVQGVELSAWSSAYARDRLGVPVITGTLQQAALGADRFDVVTLWDVIEHVPDPVPLLTEACRVLRPGGRLVLTTGDWGSRYAQRKGADWHLMTPPWHLTMFSRDTLANAAARAGLRVVAWRSEGVAGDGRVWRNKAALLASRALGLGDIVRLTLKK
jgi:2-polyprenyl-3-methyl-5-hydroxy-6-metoxy-1,4-benzoquinol methylase